MLPFSYNKNRCYLLPVDPWKLHAYWDYSAKTWDMLTQSGPLIRLVLKADNQEYARAVVPREVKSYYFTGVEPSRAYQLFIEPAQGAQGQVILTSNPAKSLSDSPSMDLNIDFGTFPIDEPLYEKVEQVPIEPLPLPHGDVHYAEVMPEIEEEGTWEEFLSPEGASERFAEEQDTPFIEKPLTSMLQEGVFVEDIEPRFFDFFSNERPLFEANVVEMRPDDTGSHLLPIFGEMPEHEEGGISPSSPGGVISTNGHKLPDKPFWWIHKDDNNNER